MVIWLIGISGAGKTTLANMLHEHYQTCNKHSYILDGDEIRAFFDGDLGFSQAEREMNVKRILLGAYLLDRNGVTVIVANISPFEHLRELARKKIDNYHEIYLQKDLSISQKNDVKGVYAAAQGKTQLVGKEIPFDEPTHPNLVLSVDQQTPQQSFALLLKYLEGLDEHTAY